MDQNDRWLSITLRAALVGLFLWMIRGLLVPIGLGALFALILYPLERRLAPRLRKLRAQAPLIITVGAIVLVVIPFALIAARVVLSINDFLSRDLTEVLNRVQSFADRYAAGIGERLHVNGASLRTGVGTVLQRLGTSIAGLAGGFAAALPGQILDVFLFSLALYYFLRDGAQLKGRIARLAPFPEHETQELFTSIHDTVRGAILGQLATSAVQGALTIAALYFFHVPGALLFGVIATLLSIIPMVGTAPVTAGAGLYLLASGRPGAAGGMLAAALIIGVSDNVVRPWMQGSQTKMHPLVTLLGIFGGLELLGAAGVFLGPVIAAMAVWAFDTYASLRREQRRRSAPAA
ncbi:MAG: AI-2E family transporter [Minicystis sp.]